MSFETRMESLDTQLTDLEAATPFVLTQDFAPNQRDWEIAWEAAGNVLPIPTYQELYWKDDFALRGEYKTLPDQFSLLSRSEAEGFEVRDIAGWETDGEHLIVFIVRDDIAFSFGTCRMYLDGTLEGIAFGSFAPDGLLGYDWYSNMLWYYEGLVVKRINYTSGAITTVFTAAANGLPEWRFFTFANTDSVSIRGDAMFGAKIGADADRSLYYYDFSSTTLTKVMTTFNPGGGAVLPDRPHAFTEDYVFLSELDSRSAFDGNKIHQIERGGYTWETEVDNGITTGDEVRTIVSRVNYTANTIEVVAAHLLPAIPKVEWSQTLLWDAALQTATASIGQPHNAMLQILRQNINDHNLDYYVDTRLYYDPAFIADGGSEVHYNSIGGIIWNNREDRFLIHDQGWHTWTNADAPDIFIYAHPQEKLYDVYRNPDDYPIGSYPALYAPLYLIDFTIDSLTQSTRKIYRISDWSQFDEDVIFVATGVLSPSNPGDTISLSTVPADYGLIEVIMEAYTTLINLGTSGAGATGGQLHSDNAAALTHVLNTTTGNFSLSELTTNASLLHKFYFRYRFSANPEINQINRHSARTQSNPGTGIQVHVYSEGVDLGSSLELSNVSLPDLNNSNNRYIVRAWRTVPRTKPIGGGYEPGMA